MKMNAYRVPNSVMLSSSFPGHHSVFLLNDGTAWTTGTLTAFKPSHFIVLLY